MTHPTRLAAPNYWAPTSWQASGADPLALYAPNFYFFYFNKRCFV
jgi:hypothetical protein